jgi:peptidoglycan hydrolase CwlO-like protein
MTSALAPVVRRVLSAIAATAVFGVLLFGPVHALPVRADTQSDLTAAEAKLNGLLKKIDTENAAIAALESQANAIATQVSDVQSRIAATQQTIFTTQLEIDAATKHLNGTQDQLNQRARVAYENGPGSGLDFLLGAVSMTDLNDRLQIVENAAQSDTDLIASLDQQRLALGDKQLKLKALQDDLQATEAQLAQQEQALQAKLASAQRVVDSLNSDKASAETLVHQLKVKQAREIYLAKLAAEQQSSGGSGGGGSISGVFFRCPVDQPHGYGDDFGAPRYSGGYHPHAGNDIVAPLGTAIRAPFPGNAVQTPNGLGGNAVTVYGADGYVYNAHLSRYGATGSVSTGTIVGYVGATGDAQGGITHDHFEWHPNVIPAHPWKSPYGYTVINGAIDPYPYLNSVC